MLLCHCSHLLSSIISLLLSSSSPAVIVVRRTPSFTRVDLQNLMNEAFIVAAKFWGDFVRPNSGKIMSSLYFFKKHFVVGKRTSILVNFDT